MEEIGAKFILGGVSDACFTVCGAIPYSGSLAPAIDVCSHDWSAETRCDGLFGLAALSGVSSEMKLLYIKTDLPEMTRLTGLQ